MPSADSYPKHVERLEAGLADYAKRSFEPFSRVSVNGTDLSAYYEKIWRESPKRLSNRTPLQLERDRILYSNGMRKQTEKYHVLYNGHRRIVRSYTTHTMRVTQVVRAICRGLQLNSDFAEAIALGSKLGAVPFIHAAKRAAAEWAEAKIRAVDADFAKREPGAKRDSLKQQLALHFNQPEAADTAPLWVRELKSDETVSRLTEYMPWAIGKNVNDSYSSGQESYWLLCVNPYTVESGSHSFSPETMFGIWRHSRGMLPTKDSFFHRVRPKNAKSVHEITWQHCSYEAIVCQYADDITWVIENINDAHSAAVLNQRPGVYPALLSYLGESIPAALLRALSAQDAGALYTFFITDCVAHSEVQLKKTGDGLVGRAALRGGEDRNSVGLSPEADAAFERMSTFLYDEVFTEPRTKHRTQMLKTVTDACLELLWNGVDESIPQMIRDRTALERWPREKTALALDLIKDPIHRIQLSVDILADMADQEIYDFVGIQSL